MVMQEEEEEKEEEAPPSDTQLFPHDQKRCVGIAGQWNQEAGAGHW